MTPASLCDLELIPSNVFLKVIIDAIALPIWSKNALILLVSRQTVSYT